MRMTETEFITLVARMRELQKLYFRTKDKSVMLKAKELEKQVDEELARIKAFTNPPAYQPSLFEEFNNTRK